MTPRWGALLAAVAVGSPLLLGPPRIDEGIYLGAVAASASGSPMPQGWYYPSFTADVFGLLGDLLLEVLRFGSLIGGAYLAALVGCAVARGWGAVPVAAVLMLVAQPFRSSLDNGNVTAMLVVVVVVAASWPSWARAAAWSAVCVCKPVSLGAALASRDRAGVVVVAAAVAAFNQTSVADLEWKLNVCTNAALQRGVRTLGADVPWEVVAAVALTGAALSRTWEGGLGWGWAAMPLSWSHTSLLLVPAWIVAWKRGGELRRVWLVAAGTVLCTSERWGCGEVAELGAVPAVAAVYVVWSSEV